MTLPVEPIKSILLLEQKRGYLDSVVAGGLSKFINYWLISLNKNRMDSLLRDELEFLKLDVCAYEVWDVENRKRFVENLLRWLEKAPGPAVDNKSLKQGLTLKREKVSPSSQGIYDTLDKSGIVPSGLGNKLSRLGIATIRDLLYYFPMRHVDYSSRHKVAQLVAGQEQTVVAEVWEARLNTFGGRRGAEAIVGDDTGNVRAVWFNQPFITKTLRTGLKVALSGPVNLFHGQLVFQSPEYEVLREGETELIHTGRVVPVYHLKEGIFQKQLRKVVKQAVDTWCDKLGEFLPEAIRSRCKLMDRPEAVRQAHFPVSLDEAEAARRRLAFDELFMFQLGVMGRKRQWQASQPGPPFKYDHAILEALIAKLPYHLTAAQVRVLNDILDDLARPVAMSRLLQGEVGSGKTVIALAALVTAVASGFQGALLAPTEILADQHYSTVRQILTLISVDVQEQGDILEFKTFLEKPVRIGKLSGASRSSEKRIFRREIADGSLDIAIGTHALIENEVSFKNLGLVVIDEQHRFGVHQRSAMRQKGFNPHILAMTATPIPRTMALTLYGDLDLSVIDELPPGRIQVKTRWVMPHEREKAYRFVWKQVSGGRQAFFICPLIEESEAIAARAAVAEFERLSADVFPDLKLGLLHGRMSGEDKDEVMRRFRLAEFQILVSTSVVEVGVDVPNATVMVVEGADRFGLAQLHQFRGRVGRGKYASYCLLMAENPNEIAQQRLKLIESTYDGFKLAEEDLKLRGPGEFYGTRQSGLPDFRMARLSDVALLEMARGEASAIFRKYEVLKTAEYRPLMDELSRCWPESIEWS